MDRRSARDGAALMAGVPPPDDSLFTNRWVHLFEEDSARGEVYAPDSGPIPLARRHRERLELRPDGSALVYGPGADDRPVPLPARWTAQDDGIILRAEAGGPPLRIIERSPTRLVVSRAEP